MSFLSLFEGKPYNYEHREHQIECEDELDRKLYPRPFRDLGMVAIMVCVRLVL